LKKPGFSLDLSEGVGDHLSATCDLSIVIVSWNVKEKLSACLESLCSGAPRGLPHEIILIDNASQDGTVEMVRSRFPNVRLITNPSNAGFAAANNQGIELAKGRYVLLLNPDTVVPEDALARLVKGMDADTAIGVASPVLTNEEGAPQYYGGMRYPGARRSPVRERPLVASNQWHTKQQPFREMAFVIGAAMIVRREVLERVGPLDAGFFMYYEDIDLCKRARDAGWRVGVFEDIRIVHARRASTGQWSDERRQQHYFAAELRFHRKHYSRLKYARLVATRWLGVVWCLCWYGTLGRVFLRDGGRKFHEYIGRLRVLIGAQVREPRTRAPAHPRTGSLA
jgi:GT2 family glycosyltransferase